MPKKEKSNVEALLDEFYNRLTNDELQVVIDVCKGIIDERSNES